MSEPKFVYLMRRVGRFVKTPPYLLFIALLACSTSSAGTPVTAPVKLEDNKPTPDIEQTITAAVGAAVAAIPTKVDPISWTELGHY